MSNSKLDISTAIAAVKSAYYGRDVRQAFVDALNAVEAAVNGIDLSQVITAHAISHNSIFRGADLSAKYSLSKLCEMVGNGDFSDIFIGDYFPISGTFTAPTPSGGTQSVSYSTKLRVAGINAYLATGATLFDKPHIVMIPDDIICKTPMNLSASTSGGYKSSFFHTDIVPALKTHFSEKFGSHLLARNVSISNNVQSGVTNASCARLTGASVGLEWLDECLTLPTEVELFGCSIWSSSPYDIGSGNRQLPLFRIAPEYISKQRQDYWLPAIASDTQYAYVASAGLCTYETATADRIGIRPILTIG